MRNVLSYLTLYLLLVICSSPSHALVVVRMETVLPGVIDVELYDDVAPLTVANFLAYMQRGDFDETFIHRSVPGFIIQGGGFFLDDNGVRTHIDEYAPVANEPEISNTRGTIAMAKLSTSPDSATSEWFFNLADNSANLDFQNGGFTVFGRVQGDGMDVVDAIAALERVNVGGAFSTMPVIDYAGVLQPENYVYINRVFLLERLVASSSLDFGSVGFAASADLAVTVKNQGADAVTLGVLGQPDAPFTIISDDCSGRTLANDESCVVGVRFTPDEIGLIESSFDITSNDPDALVLTVPLRGVGSMPLETNPQDLLAMGPVVIENSSTKSLIIRNAGGVDIAIDYITVDGQDLTLFAYAHDCAVLTPEANCEVVVTFSPLTIGVKLASLLIYTDFSGQELIEVTLRGQGRDELQPSLGVSARNLELGDESLGFLKSRSLTMINGDLADLVISSIHIEGANAAEFSVTQNCITSLAYNQQCGETITFSPVSAGPKSATLVIASNDPDTPSARIYLSGRDAWNRVAVEIPEGGQALFLSPFNTLLRDVVPQDSLSEGGRPDGVSFDFGFYQFRVSLLQGVANTAVSIAFPEGTVPDTYYKYGKTPGNSTPHWYEFMWDDESKTGAVIQGNVVTLYFADGQRGDDDLTINGVIVDPGAPAFLAESSPPPVDPAPSGGGGGCAMAKRPQLPWAALDWLLLMAGVAWLGVRRHLRPSGRNTLQASSPR
jgi:cyclophilin family peptidyl-prolyl cis-trans isomerase